MDIRSVGNQLPSGSPSSERIPGATVVPHAFKSAAPTYTDNPVTPLSKAQQTANREQVTKAVENINRIIQVASQNLEFSVDKDLNQVIVKVVDQQTKQVLRQIPSEEILEIAKSLDKLQGLLIKQTA